MGVIATLLDSPIHLQRVRTAMRDRHVVVPCEEWDELIETCEQEAVRVAILDFFIGEHPAFERVRQIRQRLPRLTLIAYVQFAPERAHDLFDAGRQGMDALIIADMDDAPGPMQALIDQAESRSLGSVVRHALDAVDPVVRDATLLTVTRAHERLSPDSLARLLGVPRRTVALRLATAGFPPPQRLLNWGRLIAAGHLLEDPRRSADRIAVSLDFPSGSAFRNTCQRYLRATPTDIRVRGGSSYVIRALLRQVEEARSGRKRNVRAPGGGGGRRLSLAV